MFLSALKRSQNTVMDEICLSIEIYSPTIFVDFSRNTVPNDPLIYIECSVAKFVRHTVRDRLAFYVQLPATLRFVSSGTDRYRENGPRGGSCRCEPPGGFSSRTRAARNDGDVDECRDACHHQHYRHYEKMRRRYRCAQYVCYYNCHIDSRSSVGATVESGFSQTRS